MSKIISFNIRLLAQTPEKREKGLMFSDPLSDDEVGLFIFPHTDNYAFWNKNVSYPLSLAFADENGKILEFGDMNANSEKMLRPKSSEIKFVIEAKKGAFEKNNIKVNDFIVYKNQNELEIKKKM